MMVEIVLVTQTLTHSCMWTCHISTIRNMFNCAQVAFHAFLTQWGRVTHICITKLTIISSDDGLSPGRHQAIWSIAEILLIWTLGTNFSEMISEIHTFSFKKMHFRMSSVKWQQIGFGLNELNSVWPLKFIVHADQWLFTAFLKCWIQVLDIPWEYILHLYGWIMKQNAIWQLYFQPWI